jgi:predicted small lipoprotein YifL
MNRSARAAALGLALAALAACGIKGDPEPPVPATAEARRG